MTDASQSGNQMALLRAQLMRAMADPQEFDWLIAMLIDWPEEHQKEVAWEYAFSHILAEPSEQKWRYLIKAWHIGFQSILRKGVRSSASMPYNVDWRRRQLGLRLADALQSWPEKVRVFSRYRPHHMLWPSARTLRLLHTNYGSYTPESCAHFTRLVLRRDRMLNDADLGLFAKMEGLRSLEIRLSALSSPQILAPLQQPLLEIDFGYCYNISHLNGLKERTSLQKLHLAHCGALQDLTDLCDLPDLRYLDLTGCHQLRHPPDQALMTTRAAVAAYQQKLKSSISATS